MGDWAATLIVYSVHVVMAAFVDATFLQIKLTLSHLQAAVQESTLCDLLSLS